MSEPHIEKIYPNSTPPLFPMKAGGLLKLFPAIRLLSTLLLLCFSLFTPTSSEAAISEDLTRSNFRASVCNIANMTINFKIEESFGEPLITSNVLWQAGPNTSSDCLSEITHIWLQARTQADGITYIKLSPRISPAGIKQDTSTRESPNWSALFCSSPMEGSPCETVAQAKNLLTSGLRFETFQVVSDTLAISNIGSVSQPVNIPQKTEKPQPSLSLDSLLADAIDTVVKPQNAQDTDEQQAGGPGEAETGQNTETAAKVTSEQRAAQAKTALNNVVTLISSSLAEYTTPAHSCESGRKVANWVQARGTCQLNFRSESSHDFLCADSGEKKSVKSTDAASINLTNGLTAISDIRVSSDGWASMSLQLSDEFHNQSEGDYKSSRWYFTTSANQLKDLQQLASSILTLKNYCESEG